MGLTVIKRRKARTATETGVGGDGLTGRGRRNIQDRRSVVGPKARVVPDGHAAHVFREDLACLTTGARRFETRLCRMHGSQLDLVGRASPNWCIPPLAPYPCLLIGKARGRIPGRDCRMDETARSLPAKRLHSRFYQALGMGYAWANDILGRACLGARMGCVCAVGFARRPVSARWRGDVRPIWRSLNQWIHILESGRP